MRYNVYKLRNAVKRYKRILKNIQRKSVLVILDMQQKEAYYSLAPLSKAIDELGADMHIQVINKESPTLAVLKDVWTTYNELKGGIKNNKTHALKEFLRLTDKKCKAELKNFFKPPEIYLTAQNKSFEGTFSLPYAISWMGEYKKEELIKTVKVIWSQVYNLKKKEKVSIGFELLRKDADLGLPLEDYLDSFQICYAMMLAVKNQVISMSSFSSRKSQLDAPERISELRTTLLGCELCKEVKEPIFRAFSTLSKLLKIDRIQIASAVFSIRGKGYSGRHIFGEYIGYPSKNRKTRWLTPGQMIYKLDHYPQTALDSRKPLARIGFTETLPIDIFIKTSYIDWLKMQKRDHKIMNIGEKCEYIEVIGKRFGKYQTKLKVGLVSKDGKRRNFRGSDVETRHLIKPDYYKKTGIKAGTMANIPGGEAFVTPEYVVGKFIGDVVISIDQSYRLSPKKPLIVECYGNSYKVLREPKEIIKKFNKKKNEAWKQLLRQEKNKSLPREIIKLQKHNFNNIGEFAINTNPKAELCDYLIVNEKIANMIHIALGSGFDPDRATGYHTDIVINSPRQKLDIFGTDKHGKKYWIHRQGKFVI